MFDALYIGATGMQAQQLNVDTIANNLANVNTAGFKKGRVGFRGPDGARRAARAAALPAATLRTGSSMPAQRLGSGVGVAGISKLFDAGRAEEDRGALDIAIRGDGFLEVTLPDGTRAFTRGGSLKVNKDGLLATQAGHPLKPGDRDPGERASPWSSPARQGAGAPAQPDRRRSKWASWNWPVSPSPGLLAAQGDNLYRATEGSGDADHGRAGEEGRARWRRASWKAPTSRWSRRW